jgi:hypothetical protein
VDIQQINYCQTDILLGVNSQDLIDVFEVKIPFCAWQYFVNMRFELLYLYFGLDRCFENEDHICDKGFVVWQWHPGFTF